MLMDKSITFLVCTHVEVLIVGSDFASLLRLIRLGHKTCVCYESQYLRHIKFTKFSTLVFTLNREYIIVPCFVFSYFSLYIFYIYLYIFTMT